jgi:RNA polymerase sigma-70 factor (ECF subfamily)
MPALPAQARSRTRAGLAALRAEVARARGRATGAIVDLAPRPAAVPAVVGIPGFAAAPDGRAASARIRNRPPGCAAVRDGKPETWNPDGTWNADGGRNAAGGRSAADGGRPDPDAAPAAAKGGSKSSVKGGAKGGSKTGEATGDVATLELAIGTRHRRVRSGIDVVELVDRIKNGEADAFGVLYDRYIDLVFRYVFYRVGNRSLAEDIVSDTFLKAMRRIGTFTWQGTDIGAWFITIARNLVVDHGRASRTRLEFPSDDVLTEIDAHSATLVRGPEESVLTLLRDRTLLDAVRTLTPDQQECVVLRFLEGLSLRETALAMGRKENAVKALQLRAVRALARHLPPAHDF